MEKLKNVISLRERVVSVGPFTFFEADQYHLVTAEREKFTDQLLKWFARL